MNDILFILKRGQMKRIIVFTLFLVTVSGLSAETQIKPINIKPTLAIQKVHHNLTLEKNIFNRTDRLKSFLQPNVREKLDHISHKLLHRLAKSSHAIDLHTLARKEVHKNFSLISNKQSDLLTFYVLGEVARILSNEAELRNRLDGMNEMSEMTSLRLQMTMDRRSKFISTLSQIMKKISTTQDILVQNIK
jgi:hypothetical protein